MTIKASFPLNMAEIAAEYGQSLPFSLRTIIGQPGLPTSGPVSFQNALGKTAAGGNAFVPVGSTSSGSPEVINNSLPSEDVSCASSATWTWSRSGNPGTASIASGGSGTLITLSCTGSAGAFRQCTFTLTGVSGGNTRYFSVVCTNDQSGA